MSKRRHGTKGTVRPEAPAPPVEEKASTDPDLRGSVVGELPIWQQFGRIGGAMTPTQVTTILSERDSGRITSFVDITHDARQKDLHLHSCLAALESDISGAEWKAQPPPGPGRAPKAEANLAKVYQAALDECAGFREMLAHSVGEGELFGHATSEVIWGYYEGNTPLLKGWFVPLRIKPISCNRFGFRTSDGRLLWDRQGTGNVDVGGVDLLASYVPGKFIQHRPRINGDVAVREGVAGAILWYALFRNWDIQDWMVAAEQGWKPFKVITWKKTGGMSDKEDAILARKIAANFVPSGGVSKPDTVDVQVEWPKDILGSSGSQHRELYEVLGQEISKGVLGHTQIVEVGTKGARSASEVGYKVSKGRKKPRALSLALTLHSHLSVPFAAFNKPGKRAPFLLPNLEDPVDLLEFGRALEKYTKGGLRTPAAWARDQLKMPEPGPGEEILDPRATGGVIEPKDSPDGEDQEDQGEEAQEADADDDGD